MNRKIMMQVFPEKVALIEAGKCPVCEKPIDLKDIASRGESTRIEFEVSGMCYTCQQAVFTPLEGDDD